MDTNIVFLGPAGATFSYDAYAILSEIFKTRKFDDADSVLVPVKTNEEILPALIKIGGGYGVIAMETKAGGRVVEPVESFIDLLDLTDCPIAVIGAIKMQLHFVLMAREGVKKESVKKILAHKKAFGACRQNIFSLGLESIESGSNGQAAEDVATKNEYKDCAALAPISAAIKYNLSVLDSQFEDEKAVTTFFLLGPKGSKPVICKNNRALIVFRLKHEAGSLWNAIGFLKEFNMIQIHSAYHNGGYDFMVELEIEESEINNFNEAVEKFRQTVLSSLIFGPFGVVEG